MTTHVIVRKDCYQDSVLLMRISAAVRALSGVAEAVVAMGTPHNRELLTKGGFDDPALTPVTANDLVIALRLEHRSVDEIAAEIDRLLAAKIERTAQEERPRSLVAALRGRRDRNLVLISLPGEHAAREARRALRLDRHVMLFSDNVSLEDEIALKQEACARGLLMMGPDCGTAILNGKPLGFANAVRPGSIGIVGAAGTGIQEVSSCIHRLGGGISQAIGTGGRDLSEAVGGVMMRAGIEALARDPLTRVLVIVSKPPAPGVAERVLEAVRAAGKPAVVHFVGDDTKKRATSRSPMFADSLAGTAEAACALAGVSASEGAVLGWNRALLSSLKRRARRSTRLCGLFCGGTTGAEALVLLSRAGHSVFSNLHKKGPLQIDGVESVSGHVLLDLGDDGFTRGRPHPMIEPVLRSERLAHELCDPAVGVLLFDVVLGFGAHADPAGVLASAVVAAREKRKDLIAIASLTGTDGDPQGFAEQQRKLVRAGITVMPDNRWAALLAAEVLHATRGPKAKRKVAPVGKARAVRKRAHR